MRRRQRPAGHARHAPRSPCSAAWSPAPLVYALAWRRGLDGYRLVLVGIGVTAVFTQRDVLAADRRRRQRRRPGHGLDHRLAQRPRAGSTSQPVALALAVLVPLTLLGARVARRAAARRRHRHRGLGVRIEPVQDAADPRRRAARRRGHRLGRADRVRGAGRAADRAAAGQVRRSRRCWSVGRVGAVLTTGADLIARTAFPLELPVGIVTAVLGAPYLIYLLVRSRRGDADIQARWRRRRCRRLRRPHRRRRARPRRRRRAP